VSINGRFLQDKNHTIYLEPLLFSAGGFFEASGAGLTLATAGTQVSFHIRARDYLGNPVSASNPIFELSGRNSSDLSVQVSLMLRVVQNFWRIDMWVNESGPVALSVEGLGVFVKGSPFALRVVPGVPSAELSRASGPGSLAAISGVETFFDLMPVDLFGNILEDFDLSRIQVYMQNVPQGPRITSGVVQRSDPAWNVTYTYSKQPNTFVRSFFMSVLMDGKHVGTRSMPRRPPDALIAWQGSPFVVEIVNDIGIYSAEKSFTRGFATSFGVAGVVSSFIVQLVDEMGIHLQTGGQQLEIEMIRGTFYLRLSAGTNST
jgi:hypothetical protein